MNLIEYTSTNNLSEVGEWINLPLQVHETRWQYVTFNFDRETTLPFDRCGVQGLHSAHTKCRNRSNTSDTFYGFNRSLAVRGG